jgi:hypothetical protein
MALRIFKCFVLPGLLLMLLMSAASPGKKFDPSRIGMQKVGTDLWIDKHEITVLDYREFLFSIKKGNYKSKLSLSNLLPDTSGLTGLLCDSKSKRDNLPIVGISREQAEEYCHFRSWAIHKSFNSMLPDKEFSLLTPEDITKINIKAIVPESHCIKPVEQSKSISGLFGNADEWLSGHKAIVEGKITDDTRADKKRTSFRCALEYKVQK